MRPRCQRLAGIILIQNWEEWSIVGTAELFQGILINLWNGLGFIFLYIVKAIKENWARVLKSKIFRNFRF